KNNGVIHLLGLVVSKRKLLCIFFVLPSYSSLISTIAFLTHADDAADATASTSPVPHAYRSASSKYPHAPAVTARRADRRHDSAGVSQMHAARCAATAVHECRPSLRIS